jgi:hypothetical protein
MVMKKRNKPKGNVVSVDFTGVKSGGATIPDGRYAAKITEVVQGVGKESGEPKVELTWEITSEKCNGREVRFDNYSLQPQALWRLKSLLEAMEVEVPDGETDVDFDELISDETECIIEVTGQKSESGDRTYARVTGHAPLADGNTVDDEDESPKTRGNKPKKDEEEDDPPKRRGGKEEEEEEDNPPKGPKKLKKGAKVKFKDDKNKAAKGTIESIDGDMATVVTDNDDMYEMDVEELTVIS